MNVLLLIVLSYITVLGSGTPLDDYVKRADPTYQYTVMNTTLGDGYTFYTINMTSQTWKPNFQSRPIWWHILYITVPENLTTQNSGLLDICGDLESSHKAVTLTQKFAVSTGTIGAVITLVPNEPIVFKNDPDKKPLEGNALLAWTWKTFVDSKGKDPDVLLHLPMTKACVRAMDTIHDLVLNKKKVSVDRFLVSGHSKRGWTAWNLAAVDKRVVALAPIVMDVLYFVKNFHHVYRALGGWSFAFKSFYDVGITKYLDSPYVKQMAEIVDPIYYKDRLENRALYIISAGGDELFMVDDTNFYFNELKGRTYLRMVPNTDHKVKFGVNDTIFTAIQAFYLSVMKNESLPQIHWTLNTTSNGGEIVLKSSAKPLSVFSYYATTLDGKRKDFRLFIGKPGNTTDPIYHPVIWQQSNVKQTGPLSWSAKFETPKVGWTAFFIQVTFEGLEKSVLEFTTQTLIIPDTYPFPDCHGQQCHGKIV